MTDSPARFSPDIGPAIFGQVEYIHCNTVRLAQMVAFSVRTENGGELTFDTLCRYGIPPLSYWVAGEL